MECSEKIAKNGLNLKATELRLGLPGSDLPTTTRVLKGLVSGAKRGFVDAIDGDSGRWLFSGGGGGGGGKAVKDGVSEAVGPKSVDEKKPQISTSVDEKKPQISTSVAKAQVVGWPPIRSFRKNSMASHPPKNDDDDCEDDTEGKMGSECLYVKVSMDGAPYLRKVDLKIYGSYMELSSALEKMFRCFTIGQCGSHGVPGRDRLSESRLMDLLHGSEYVLTYEDKDGDWMLVGDVPWEMFTDSCKRLRITKSSDAIGLAPGAMEKCKTCN